MTSAAKTKTVVVYDPIVSMRWSYEIERNALRAKGIELIVPDGTPAARAALPSADVVLVSQQILAEDIDLIPVGAAILCYSVGTDGVDAARAGNRGLSVHNVPDYCTEEVSDHALALLLALFRNLLPTAIFAGCGDWPAAYRVLDARLPRRFRDQTVGVLGLGRIGSRVADKCAALGMTVIGHDPWVSSSTSARLVDRAALLGEADAVVICAALTSASTYLMDDHTLRSMKPGSYLVNVARGRLINESALAAVLNSGHLAGAALDVRAQEPPDPGADPLANLDSVLLTPHMGATSAAARTDLHRRAAEIILRICSEDGQRPA